MSSGDFVQGASAQGTSTAPAATLAGAPTSGSLLVAGLSIQNGNVVTAASGWAKAVEFESTGSGVDDLVLLYKTAGGAEAAAQAPATLDSSEEWLCGVLEFEGAWDSTPLDVANIAADNDATKTSPAVNPVDSVKRLMIGIANSGGDHTFSSPLIGGAAATERVDLVHSGSAGVCLALWSLVVAPTGAGTYTAQATCSVSADGACGIAAFEPGPNATILATVAASTWAVLIPSVLIGYTLPLSVLTAPARPPILVVESD